MTYDDIIKTAADDSAGQMLSFKTDKQQILFLDKLAKEWKCSRSLLIRTAIRKFMIQTLGGDR
jgi:hypothetical protein